MNNKLYYWPENVDNYTSDNEDNYNKIIEIKRLNFFIGKNNAGKSRFLRSFFISKTSFHRYQMKLFRQLLSVSQELQEKNEYKYLHGKEIYNDFIAQMNSFQKNLNSLADNSGDYFKYCLDYLERMGLLHKFGPNNHTSNLKNEYQTQYKDSVNLNLGTKKFYLPTLRGMRPVTEIENKQPYIERAKKDYFKDLQDVNEENIITGECLYYELKVHLLGEPEQRDLIKIYEEKLSQYFFDNEPVSLIPKHDQDVVNIKIGRDKQFPISQLGDGLQQAIILTYEAFTKKDEIYSFFIEEPELHMHAGMVRQLMNFYLNETKHYYFFTTHSNHLLDMADESDQVIIQKFVKQPKPEDPKKFEFKIYRCDRDRDLLASLGVKPSSVYLANCTIWVEGITDRLYITKYMEKFLSELKTENTELYKQYRRFMPNYHYTFVEYAGSNLVHWDFSDEFTEHLDDRGMNALLTTSSVLLIADGDIKNKSNRVEQLNQSLGDKFLLLECKETENTIPSSLVNLACHIKFSGLKEALATDENLKTILSDYLSIDGMQNSSKEGFDISRLSKDVSYFHQEHGIGQIIDNQIKVDELQTSDDKPKRCFADKSGTIKEKLKFCRLILTLMDHMDWELTQSARELCDKIFIHISTSNASKTS
ncbi:AAA family ATPase [Acinetobacter sp. A11]